jgi:hypothetical protein
MEPPIRELGCSKCRYAPRGCGRCRSGHYRSRVRPDAALPAALPADAHHNQTAPGCRQRREQVAQKPVTAVTPAGITNGAQSVAESAGDSQAATNVSKDAFLSNLEKSIEARRRGSRQLPSSAVKALLQAAVKRQKVSHAPQARYHLTRSCPSDDLSHLTTPFACVHADCPTARTK